MYKQPQNGIIATNSNLIVKKSRFLDIQRVGVKLANRQGNGSLDLTGLGPEFGEHTFLNCETGVYASKSNVEVSDCLMEEIKKGVEIRNAKNKTIDIYDNLIKASQFGVITRNNTPLNSGKIRDNQIWVDGKFTLSGIASTAGISCNENTVIGNSTWGIKDNEIVLIRGDAGISGAFQNVVFYS